MAPVFSPLSPRLFDFLSSKHTIGLLKESGKSLIQPFQDFFETSNIDPIKIPVLTYSELSNDIISSAIKVHRIMGPGLLESAYRRCLSYELQRQGISIENEKPMPIVYEGMKLEHGYRIDILVEGKIVVEIKAVETFTRVHFEQVLTYLRLGQFKVAYYLTFM